MNEPTIDEMLEWINEASTGNRVEDEARDEAMRKAIRTILERYRIEENVRTYNAQFDEPSDGIDQLR